MAWAGGEGPGDRLPPSGLALPGLRRRHPGQEAPLRPPLRAGRDIARGCQQPDLHPRQIGGADRVVSGIGWAAPSTAESVVPNSAAQSMTCGRIAGGISNIPVTLWFTVAGAPG